MLTKEKTILITGGAGFIGSHVVRHFVRAYKQYHIINFDALTYAGNLENNADIQQAENYTFVKGNITDLQDLQEVFQTYGITDVIHLAAESHVDRSILNPNAFIETNVLGTAQLLAVALQHWKETISSHRFYHISTDEVFGSLGDTGYFTETTPYDPRSPYSASKAASDHIVRSYFHTYHMPIVISNCSNNYGPNQFPEKLIPLMIHNIKHEKPLPVYGAGTNVRDWLYVQDHVDAIDLIFHTGTVGETYNIGGRTELQNIQLVHLLCDIMDKKLNRSEGSSRTLIQFVKDRPGHDQRYAIDCSKIENELNWTPKVKIQEGLEQTIQWYLTNTSWLENVTSGAYKAYYQMQYQS